MAEETNKQVLTIKLEWFFSGRLHLENKLKSMNGFRHRANIRFGINNVTLSEPLKRFGGSYVAEMIFNEKVEIYTLLVNVLKRKGSKTTFEITNQNIPITIGDESTTIQTKIIDYKSGSNTSGIVSKIYLNISNDQSNFTMLDIIENKDSIEQAIAAKVVELFETLIFFNENVTREMFSDLERCFELCKHNNEEITVDNLHDYCPNNIEYPVFTKMVEMYLKYIN